MLILKRALDISVASIALVALSPLLAAVALLIKLDSKGPAFFLGKRAGLNGRPFWMYKFRTMFHVEHKSGTPDAVASRDDPRITRVGAQLRRFKLDELPQLINVVRGEMSLVGPRPEGLRYMRFYTGERSRVLSVSPGITGLSQIEYIDEGKLLGDGEDYETIYTEQILPRKLDLDLRYVDDRSLAGDLRIILRTLLRLFQHA